MQQTPITPGRAVRGIAAAGSAMFALAMLLIFGGIFAFFVWVVVGA